MTSLLRRKPPTTARGPSTATTTASERRASWALRAAGLVLFLAGTPLMAQVYKPVPAGAAGVTQTTPARPQPAPVVPAALQPPQPPTPALERAIEEAATYTIQTEPPGPERLFGRLDTEAELLERIRQQGRQLRQQDADVFPEEIPGPREPYPGRHWDPSWKFAEPAYVCYEKLLFEQRNSERFGWDLGMVQPFVSLGAFYFDFVTLPYHVASRPHCCFDCSSGYCLPGDPVPYLLYPPEISVTGAVAEVGVVVAMFAIFP